MFLFQDSISFNYDSINEKKKIIRSFNISNEMHFIPMIYEEYLIYKIINI